MRSKVKFEHPKWPTSAILSKISKKIKVAYRCEMDRNEIESDFRTSKMAAGSYFVQKIQKKLKLRIDLKWPERRSKVKFGHPKWPMSAIVKNLKKNKFAYRCEMDRNEIKNGGSHFVKKNKKSVLI